MSFLSQVTGVNIDFRHKSIAQDVETVVANAPAAIAAAAPVVSLVQSPGKSFPIQTAAGSVITELDPNLLVQVESVINGILVKAGVAADIPAADALIAAELNKIL